MQAFRIIIPRFSVRAPVTCTRLSSSASLTRLFRQSLQKSLQGRCYSQQVQGAKPSRLEEELRRAARAIEKTGKAQVLPERLIIYHAGTGRTTFLAMIKITTLFMGAFFCFVVAPSYVKAEKPEWQTAGVALCGIIPILFVGYITSPFVTHIYLHLPSYARAAQPILERYVASLPPTADLTITTMSAIGKPRYSVLKAGDLMPTRKRFGIVNYERDTAAENARRKWYNFRAVGNFYVQQSMPIKVRYQKKGKVDAWIWDAVKEKVGKKAQAGNV